jgi:hypothetical protein
MNPEETQPASPVTPADKPRTAAPSDRPPIGWSVAFGAVMAVVYLVIPAIFKAHYEYLFWGEGFMERAYGMSFLTGNLHKMIETPKPLWSLFWLLGRTPNQLLIFVGLMVGAIFTLFALVSWKLSRSVLPGILASLLLVFGCKSVLELMAQGSWIIPYILLGLVFLLALYSRRFGWATLAVGLIGLFRPDGWFLAVFLLVYVGWRREGLKWYYFLPLLAPFLWMYYDHRISGDWLFTYRMTVAYAVLTGVPGTNFVNFWRVMLSDMVSSTGVLLLLYALAGIVYRARNLVREAKGSKFLAVVLDPLFAVSLLPLFGYWLLSLQGNITIMARFAFLSVGLFALYALLLPIDILRNRPVANRGVIVGVIWLPLLLVGLVRLPVVGKDVQKYLKITESKMAAIEGLCEVVNTSIAPADQYKFIFVPLRRYAQFSRFLDGDLAQKLLSYREVSLATICTQLGLTEGGAPEPPKGSPEFLKRIMQGGWGFADFMPSLALWIPDDEQHYIDAFAFDEPDYFRKNYIDHGRYGFRVIGQALDSLGLIYDVRDLAPEQIRVLPPSVDTARGQNPADTTR